MSEKRFVFATNEKWFLFDNETEDFMDMEDCKDKLNELAEENEQLRQSQDVKEFSALFNQSIALQREIKDLKDDLYNCRLNKNIIREKLKLWQDVHKEYNIYNIKDFEELMKKVK